MLIQNHRTSYATENKKTLQHSKKKIQLKEYYLIEIIALHKVARISSH